MRYETPLYVRLHRTLYANFGEVAARAEALGVVTTLGLARCSRPYRTWYNL